MKENKTAVVTGAGKGIGKTIAIGLAKLGYNTILVGRNKQNLENAAQEIGSNAKVLQLDITDRPAVKEAIAKIVSEKGGIDILVNNAGIYFDGSVDLPDEEFEKMLKTNLTAQFSLLKEVVPVMKAQKSGYIFNVASRAGKVGFAGGGAYSASKFGLVGLSESLYRELNPLGIKVTALCPGWVNTDMAYDAGTPLESEEMIQPEDLFKTIEWLLQLSPAACVKEVVLESPKSIS
ncbi:SDR family oxidoreductase [Draconibacterium sp. IB214405]|uniref:SDR family oxidoreductase n=1 Tax=Draconibacterium sp. IB214405 TaxID=3097352 RepID=UPI002A0D40E8|nr:SDR family oxidoreductase [Draconibacterium sp. IB214405]MDX8338234.1 SDR family oxidoreductase [Draconibacterium sp. IB214405]